MRLTFQPPIVSFVPNQLSAQSLKVWMVSRSSLVANDDSICGCLFELDGDGIPLSDISGHGVQCSLGGLGSSGGASRTDRPVDSNEAVCFGGGVIIIGGHLLVIIGGSVGLGRLINPCAVEDFVGFLVDLLLSGQGKALSFGVSCFVVLSFMFGLMIVCLFGLLSNT